MKWPPAAAGLLASACALAGYAETLPLWELGAGAAVLTLPDYRGSDESRAYLLPIPYVIYRGDVLKADRSGISTRLFDNDRLELSLSLNGTLPVKSENNVARRGMANLKPTLELGPTLDAALWRSADRKTALDFRIPLRAVFTLQSSPSHIGWLLYPNLHLRLRDPSGMPGWRLGLTAGPQFTSRKYNAYFYSVDPVEATSVRPAYVAAAGYGGTQLNLALSKRFTRYWVGAFVRHDSVAGAVFAGSPLVKRSSALSAGIAVSWIFGVASQQTSQQAAREDEE